MKLKDFMKNLLTIAIVSFIFQLAWEYWACGLFYRMNSSTDYNKLLASATFGDINMTLGLYLLLSIVNKDVNWFIKKWSSKEFTIIILYSLFFSFYFEISALYLGRWGYNDFMPLFPKTNIGLVPVLQLIILFPLTFLVSKLIINKIKKIY